MGGGWGLCLGPTGLEKAVGVGLRYNRTEGAQACPSPLVSENGGPHLGAQQASWAQVGMADALLSSPAPPVWEGPSRLPLLFSPRLLSYAPKDPQDLEGALEGRGLAWELSRLPGPERAGQTPSAPGGPLPPSSPGLPGLPPMPPGAHVVWRGQAQTLKKRTVYTFQDFLIPHYADLISY